MTRLSLFTLVLTLALTTGCGSGGGQPGHDALSTRDARVDAPPGSPDARRGDGASTADASPVPSLGELELYESQGPYGGSSSALLGALSVGGLPVWQQETKSDGTCRLLVYKGGFCEEPCDGMCVADNVCKPYPTYTEAGALTVKGAKVAISVTPEPYGFGSALSYYWGDQTADLFDDGATLTASFAGGKLPAFSVAAGGVPPLVLQSVTNHELALPNGGDVTFRWTPPAAPTPGSRLRLTLNANNAGGHGSPYAAIILCDAPDTGSLTIPRAMVEAFPRTYRWEMCAGNDCPLSSAMRYRRGTTDLAAGRVELRVGSRATFFVLHELP